MRLRITWPITNNDRTLSELTTEADETVPGIAVELGAQPISRMGYRLDGTTLVGECDADLAPRPMVRRVGEAPRSAKTRWVSEEIPVCSLRAGRRRGSAVRSAATTRRCSNT